MMHVFYPGTVVRYVCNAGRAQYGESTCISFGGLRVDAAVSHEVLQAVSGNALQAALEATEQMQQKRKICARPSNWNSSRLVTKHVWQLGDTNLSTLNSGWLPQN